MSVYKYFNSYLYTKRVFPGGASGKEPSCQFRRPQMRVQSLGWEDALEEGMATHSSIVAWRIHRQRRLVGYSPNSHKETQLKRLSTHACTQKVVLSFLSIHRRIMKFFQGLCVLSIFKELIIQAKVI